MPKLSDCTLRVGAQLVEAAYFRGQNLVAPAYTLPTPILVESFDSLTGWAVTNSAVIALNTDSPVQGTASMTLSHNPATGQNGTATKNGEIPYSASGFNVMAYLCDHGSDPEMAQNGAQIRLGMTGVNYPSGATVSRFPDYGGATGDYILGKIWKFCHTDDLSTAGMTDGTAVNVRVMAPPILPYSGKSDADCLVANAAGRPTIVLTFDDGRNGPYNQLAYMQERGIRGTLYLPWEQIGTNDSSLLNLAKLAEMKALGWDMQLDGTGNDAAITSRHSTVAEAVAHLEEGNAWLASNGLNPNSRHFCYPNGTIRIAGTRVSLAAVTRTAGSAVCTMSSTTGISTGMKVVGFGIPSGATVATVDSGTEVTMSANATGSSSGAATFTDTSGAFHTGKLQAGLRAAGWLTGRTTAGGPVYSRYGIGDQGLILPGHTTTDAVLGGAQAHIDQVVKYGATKILYIHDIFNGATWINMDTAIFRNWIDALVAARDAGQIDILTLSQWYTRDCANPAAPPLT